jgi:hypothetical protein
MPLNHLMWDTITKHIQHIFNMMIIGGSHGC